MPGPPSLQPKTEIGPLFLLFKAHFSLNLPKQIVHPLLANEISPNPKTKITKPDFSSRQMLQLFNYREQRLQPYLLHNLYNSPPASAAVVGWLRLTGTVLVAWWTPYGTTKCIICKQQVHQDGKYCHTCAYSKGVCAMCGKQVLDTKHYKQSNV